MAVAAPAFYLGLRLKSLLATLRGVDEVDAALDDPRNRVFRKYLLVIEFRMLLSQHESGSTEMTPSGAAKNLRAISSRLEVGTWVGLVTPITLSASAALFTPWAVLAWLEDPAFGLVMTALAVGCAYYAWQMYRLTTQPEAAVGRRVLSAWRLTPDDRARELQRAAADYHAIKEAAGSALSMAGEDGPPPAPTHSTAAKVVWALSVLAALGLSLALCYPLYQPSLAASGYPHVTVEQAATLASFENDVAAFAYNGSRRSELPDSARAAVRVAQANPGSLYDGRTMYQVLMDNARALVAADPVLCSELRAAARALPSTGQR